MPRRYDSTLRQMQAQRTREAVLDAGQALITETGYARITMRAIAERAGVSVDTIYLHFRSKAAVLKALLDIAVGGDEAPIPVADRDWVHQIRGQPGARPALAEFAASVTSVHARLAPLLIAARAAADADATAAALWEARKSERLHGMHDFAAHLVGTGELQPTLTTNDTRDRLFALASPELYGLLVLELGWRPERYTSWLTELLTQQLLR